ncbi:MAG: FMN-binding negative transcriptional regulator [Pseudorhodoplanes sp.]
MLYLPPAFRESDVAVLQAQIRAIGFGSLITTAKDGGILISQFPVMLDTAIGTLGQLRCHVSRANPQWRDSDLTKPGIVMFSGPDAYVSPSWYPSKHEHGKAVPTWNYITICARGLLEVYDDRESLMAHVTELTELHEAAFPEPWKVTDAPTDYMERQLKGIVGFRLTIEALEGKKKLSQNRSVEDRDGVAEALQATDDPNARDIGTLVQATTQN